MQGVISLAKPHFYTPVVPSHRYRRSRVQHPLDVPVTFSFPLKKMTSSVKIKACPLHFTAFSDSFVNKQPKGFLHNLEYPSLRRGSYLPRASKDNLFSFPPYPPMTEKPKWWWRSLACLPYLMNFLEHLTWAYSYAHPSKNPPPFLENFDNLAFPLRSSLLALPKFFLSGYTILFYCWLVRRKEWPHFFRFHVSNALLLGSLVQVIGTSSGWVPVRFFPPHFWSAATFLFLVTVSECIRCALCGVYPSIPFVKDAALLHSDLKIR